MKKASFLALAFLCLAAIQSIYANDECATAINVPVGSCFSGTTVGATFSSTAPTTACGSFSGSPLDVWFTTTVPATGNIRITAPVVPSPFLQAEIYTGTCGALSSLTASAGISCNLGPFHDPIIFTGLTPGSTLIIRCSTLFDNVGDLDLCVDDPSGCTDRCATNYDPNAAVDDGSCLGPITNAGADECAAATPLPGPGEYVVNNNNATLSNYGACDLPADTPDVWFSYPVGIGLDTLAIATCRPNFAPGVSLWDACGGSEIDCDNFGGVVVGATNCGSDDIPFTVNTITGAALDAIEGTTILIRVTAVTGMTGCGDLVIDEVADPFACDATTPPTSLTASVSASTLEFNWDAFPNSVGCQIQAGPFGGGFPIKRNFIGAGLSGSGPIPTSIIAPGNYQARLVCACSISPLAVSPPSNTVFFTIPAPRLASLGNLALAPNPAQDQLQLSLDSWSTGELTIAVFNVLGSEMLSLSKQLNPGHNNFLIDLTSLESGSYFIKLTNGSLTSTEQFQVVK